MDRIRLGKTELMVTRLGFGGIPIQRVSEEEAVAIVRRCLDFGLNFIDTANAYTTSEASIGKAISGRLDDVILATKTTSLNDETIRKHLEQSLKSLGVDCIDLYQLHNVSTQAALDKVLSPEGPLKTLEEAKKEGKIKHIGITSHQIDVAKRAVASDKFETIMFPLNFIAHEAAADLLPLARQHDVGYICMKPLAGGAVSDASVAIKYLLEFPDILIIPGIERIEEIEEIVGIVNSQPVLDDADRERMNSIRQELGPRFCHRCDYCQPCPQKIPISLVMAYPSMFKRMPPSRVFSGMNEDAMEAAAKCTECGSCEERCPYNLPVREMLKEYVARYRADKSKYAIF